MLVANTVVHGRYRILRQIGRGGMGTVYEAVDERLDSRVALKQLHASEAAFETVFKREARLLANLRHPALPFVTDFFSDSTGQYLVMQFITGDDLATLIHKQHGPFPTEQVIEWAVQLLEVLTYLHSQQPPIIHHDVKPQNLKQTTGCNLVLLDFGLAKLMSRPPVTQSDDDLPPTEPSLNAYTLQYAPVEQIEGIATDPRSDLYAASATLYHLFTGVAPAQALTRVNALIARKPDPLRPAHEVNLRVSFAVSTVLMRGLALHADDRPASAAEMLQMLKEAAQHISPKPADAPQLVLPTTKVTSNTQPAATNHSFPKIRRVFLIAALAGLLLVVLFLRQQPSPVAETSLSGTKSVEASPLASLTTSPASGLTLQATDEPHSSSAFQTIPLSQYVNDRLDFQAPPVGELTLDGIPFTLSEQIFKSQSSFPPGDSAPTELVIPLQVPQAYRLHLLINTGNGFTLYKGKVIGEVNVTCAGTIVKVASLELGREVREWHVEGKVVESTVRSRQVWQGDRTDAPGLEGFIDLLSLDLPPVCRSGTLSSVAINDTSTTTVNSLDPALNVAGVTVEHYR